MADPAQNELNDDKNVLKPDEDKVTYNVSISVPDIISALHQKAIGTAEKKAKDIRIVNSAIEVDGQKAKLKSAGQHIISVLSTQKDGKVKRSDAIVALKEYVHWFVGPDLKSKITDKVVLSLDKDNAGAAPATDDSQPSGQQSSGSSQSDSGTEDDGEQPDDNGSVQNASDEQTSDNDYVEYKDDDQKAESLGTPVHVKSFKDFLVENCGLSFLFEENDLVQAGENKPAKKDDTAVAKREEGGALVPADNDKGGKKANDNDPEAMGWYIGYDLKVKGLKESKIKDALKSFAAAWLDGITIHGSGLWGSNSVISGKNIRKGIHNTLHIDHEKLAHEISDYIQKKYPNTDHVTVNARDKDTLLKDLADAGANVDAAGKKKIANAAYSLTIKVKEEDPKKPFFTVAKIAEIIKKCMRFGKKHSVDAADVIKVENFKDDNDAASMSNNAKRPSSAEMQNVFEKAKGNNRKNQATLDKKSILAAKLALDVFTNISKKFQALRANKTANQEKENKKAIELFNDFKKQYEKAAKGNADVQYKLFDDFLTKYKKFEAGLEESVSMKFLSKRDIITLLLESLFDEVPASEIFEADDDRLSKATEEDKQGAIDVDSAFVQGTDSNSAENKQESKKDEKEEVKREEATPDFEQLSRSLKVDAIRFLQKFKVTVHAAIRSKNDVIVDLEDSYKDDISKLKNIKRKYVAVIDLDQTSSLKESVHSVLMNLLFETYDDNKKHDDRDVADADFVMKDDSSNVSRNENSNTEKLDVNTNTSQDNNIITTTITKIFNLFKQNFGIKDEEADDIITLTQQVKESCRSFARDMLLEVNDNKKDDGADDVFIEDALAKLNSLTVKFAKSKVSNGKETINISYTSYCGLTADTIKFFEDKSGINVGTHKGSLDEHKYAMGFIVRMPKKDDERSYNGSPAAKYFTDSEVKKMFKDALKSRKFQMAVIEGVAKKLKYNNTSVHPDVKLFIASFDDEEKKDDKKDDKSNSDGKSSKHKDVENKLAKAYILPFDYYKDVEKSTEDEDNNEGNETGGESSSSDDTGETQTADKVEGTDLYIFPIKSSKMFEKTAGDDE